MIQYAISRNIALVITKLSSYFVYSKEARSCHNDILQSSWELRYTAAVTDTLDSYA